MEIDNKGNLKLNWLERILIDERFGYAFLFSIAFATAFFHTVNTFIFKIFLGSELMLFSKLISLILVPMMVGGILGLSFIKLMEIKFDYRKRQRWLNRRK